MIRLSILIFVSLLIFLGCTPPLPNAVDLTSVTAIPTPSDMMLCDVGQDDNQSWDVRIEAFEELLARGQDCDMTINLLLYTTYIEYGQFLEADDQIANAQAAYDTALQYFPDGTQAQARLENFETTQSDSSESTCSTDNVETLPAYTPAESEFITLTTNGFIAEDNAYSIYGVTYYPSKTPFDLFLIETTLADVETEFDLIQSVGVNTLKIYLRSDDLFVCDAIPKIDTFSFLDDVIQLANTYNLRLIVVLNHDVAPTVLYREVSVLEQIQFVVDRYKNEPTILAWDLRDRPDADYQDGQVTQTEVINWLADTLILVRTLDSHHPVTIGFEDDALLLAPLVDFVSFQFYGDYEILRQEIANLRASANRPILLSGIGYSTFTLSDVRQRNLLFQVFEEVENNGLMGWMVNHAFDYPRTVTCIPPDCPGSGREINQYGLWNTGYFPKLAIEAIRIATGLDE